MPIAQRAGAVLVTDDQALHEALHQLGGKGFALEANFSFPALWECLEFYRFRLKKSSMSLGAIRTQIVKPHA